MEPEDPITPVPEGKSRWVAGQHVGGSRYELIRLLGEGGMGVVWLAKDLRLGEQVALKFLPREIGSDPVALDDMRRETLKSRKLSHANIIRIHDLFEAADEAPFISMEYIDGPNLSSLRLQQVDRLFSWDYLKPIVKQLCEALDYAHSENVIHRDLKPANMMLDGKGRLKLADFGIAATLSDSGSRVSVKHLTSGTMTYMSPQQMDGEAPRMTDDIYALGATLYELLTSKPPFYTGDILHQVRNIPAKPMAERLWELSLTNPIPADVAAMVMACLAKDPAARPLSARAVADWIGLTGIITPAKKSDEKTIAEETAAQIYAPKVKKGALAAIGVAIFAVLIGSLGYLFTHRNNHPQSTAAVETAPTPKEMDEEEADTPTNSPPPATQPPLPQTSGSFSLLDESFGGKTPINGGLDGAVTLPDGKVVIAGYFNKVNGVSLDRVARLNPDGTVDATYNIGKGANDRNVYGMALQPDKKVILVGRFTEFNGRKQDHIVRLNEDGSIDTGFVTQVPLQNVFRVQVLANGKILIGGDFKQVNNVKRSNIARLNPNGEVDLTFDPGDRAGQPIRCLVLQSDGKILAGGNGLTSKTSPGWMTRLLPDGQADPAFGGSKGANGQITSAAAQADGKIIVGGKFTKFGNVDRSHLARLNPDGSLDKDCFSGPTANAAVYCVAIDRSGRLLVGGDFSSFGGVLVGCIVRLNEDNTVDKDFTAGFIASSSVHNFFSQSDGNMLASGFFKAVNGKPRPCVARILYRAPTTAPAVTTSKPSVPQPEPTVTTTNSIMPAAAVNMDLLFPGNKSQIESPFEVSRGACYEITADGQMKAATGTAFGPAGAATIPITDQLGPNTGKDSLYLGQHSLNSLIAQIEGQPWSFYVGTRCRFVAPSNGRLIFHVNTAAANQGLLTGQFRIGIHSLTLTSLALSSGTVDITARVDSVDELHIQPQKIFWRHTGGGKPVGLHAGYYPTIVNGVYWWPQWETNTSKPWPITGLFPTNGTHMVIQKINGRGKCNILKENTEEAVIQIEDGGVGSRTTRVTYNFR